MSAVVVVPVKAFSRAKVRLSDHLSSDRRAELAKVLAEIVITAAAPCPVSVVCDDHEVRRWAEDRDLDVVWTPGLGLNGAVEAAVTELRSRCVERAIVAHADLVLARSLSWLADEPGITIVPDRHRDGTNVVSVPTSVGFRFGYGPGSFRRHLVEGLRTTTATTVVADPELGLDIDRPADLAEVPAGLLPARFRVPTP